MGERLVSYLQYEPLSWTDHETRFLRPLGRNEQGELSYKVETWSLVHPPEYVAMSYVWYETGDTTQAATSIVVVDGVRVPITNSLAAALRNTSWPEDASSKEKAISERRLVWADQICINQADEEERSLQIQRMGMIYAGAWMVYVWLGSASHDSDRAMEACRRAWNLSGEGKRIELSRHEKDAIAALVRRRYFERVWVIQEFAKAGRRLLLCGRRSTPWTGLEKALVQMQGHVSAESMLLMDALKSFILREQESRLAVPRMLMMQALIDSRRSQATEARDKIFALLGLTRDGGEVVPLPHYKGSDALFFIQVARHFVAKQGHTAAILLAARTEDHEGLPSWVPNWGRWCAEIPPWVVSAVEAERESLRVYDRYIAEPHFIRVPGLQLETIESCADAASLGNLRMYQQRLSIAELERFRMKIAWNERGRPRVVHHNAAPGDLICRLENCILPVVLRKAESGAFRYVGEVLRESDDTKQFWGQNYGLKDGRYISERIDLI